MLDVKRQECAGGTQTIFTMGAEASAFIVKNYGPEVIYVCLEEWDKLQSVRIDPGYYQRIVSNLTIGGGDRPKTDTVIVSPHSDVAPAYVEVQRDD
ncbi:MAG: hypothetical protein ACI3XW_09380 [Butyricicoccus sp.]